MPPSRKASPPDRPPSRVGMADIARQLGVSIMTVSYALRKHPKIPPATRDEVQRMAVKLGYTPSPEISRLMHLLRGRMASVQRCNLGVLTFSRVGDEIAHLYSRKLLAGARLRAEEIGYAIDEVVVDVDRLSARRTTQILESRGIRGVLIPPPPRPLDCGKLLDWSKFSVVAATYSVKGVSADRVVPNHLANCRLLFARLLADGYKTIGVAVGPDLSSRFNDCHHATYCQLRDRGELRAVPWLGEPDSARLKQWLRRYRPEAIVADSTSLRLLRATPGLHVVVLDRSAESDPPGIDQLPEAIGRSAVELLAGKITRGEFGLPEHTQVTMVDGVWREPPLTTGLR